MIVRIPPDTSQIANAKPAVIQNVCLVVTTFFAVLSSTWNAGPDICGLMFFAMSDQTLSRLRKPSSARPNRRNGTIAVMTWNESALAHVNSLRRWNARISSRAAETASTRSRASVAVAMPSRTRSGDGLARSDADAEAARDRRDRPGQRRRGHSRLPGVLARQRCRSHGPPAHVAEWLGRQRPRAPARERQRRPLVFDAERERRQD